MNKDEAQYALGKIIRAVNRLGTDYEDFPDVYASTVKDIAEYFTALSDHLAEGGDLPHSWANAGMTSEREARSYIALQDEDVFLPTSRLAPGMVVLPENKSDRFDGTSNWCNVESVERFYGDYTRTVVTLKRDGRMWLFKDDEDSYWIVKKGSVPQLKPQD